MSSGYLFRGPAQADYIGLGSSLRGTMLEKCSWDARKVNGAGHENPSPRSSSCPATLYHEGERYTLVGDHSTDMGRNM